MNTLPQAPNLSWVNPDSMVDIVKQSSFVLLIANDLSTSAIQQAFPGSVVHTIDSSSHVDFSLKQMHALNRIDMIWIRNSHAPDTLNTATEAMKRARFLVIELGRAAFNSSGQLDASRKGMMYRVTKLAHEYRVLGYDPSGTFVLQNIRDKRANQVALPSPRSAPPVNPPSPSLPMSPNMTRKEPVLPPARTKPVITMERLGMFGQWGKQVVQYAFVRSYARDNKIDCEVPQWAGRYLFGFNDPEPYQHISPVLEETASGQHVVWGRRLPPRGKEFINHDFIGWAQFDTNYYLPNKEFIQSLYAKPTEPQRSRVMLALDKLHKKGCTLIGLHLRRGDSGRTVYPLTPIGWCLQWLYSNWDRFDKPVLYIATEDSSLRAHFQGYNVAIAEDVGIHHVATPYPGHIPYWNVPGRSRSTDFFPDWFILQQSDVVLASNSMFSMSAAWTSTANKETWRPKLSLQDFERIDPWNMRDFVNREHLDDYPGIPGTQLDDNPGYNWLSFHPTTTSIPEQPETFEQWMKPVPKLNLSTLPTTPDITFPDLQSHVGNARVILEIGSADGRDTNDLLKHFPLAKIYCFEPDPRCLKLWRKSITNSRATMTATAIGDRTESVSWYASHGRLPDDQRATSHDLPDIWDDWPISGSIKQPEFHLRVHPWVTFDQTTQVPITTLDTWMQEHPEIDDIDLIWMDVQGAEREVLLGGTKTFQRTRWVVTEVFDDFYHPTMKGKHIYKGQPNIAQILALLPTWHAVIYAHSQNILLKNSSPKLLKDTK